MSGSWQSKCHQGRFRGKTNLELDGCSDEISTHVQMITFPPFRVWYSGVAEAVESSFQCSCFVPLFLTFYLDVAQKADTFCHSDGIN